jgi:hypothetical protein
MARDVADEQAGPGLTMEAAVVGVPSDTAAKGDLEARLELELRNDGAELVAFVTGKGFVLELIEATEDSCTVRAARGAGDEHPCTVTVTVEDVVRAGLDNDSVLGQNIARLLRVWALVDAARFHLADAVMELDADRQLRPLGLKAPSLSAPSAERARHHRELLGALKTYRTQVLGLHRALVRVRERGRARRGRRTTLRRSPARSPGSRREEPDPPSPLEAAA